ncbi:energy transducer TonB family protein [Chelativorans salis]|uniref:TonB family protein n=1 Tax=Chelativorans salis TaxID=2978478 RepID=A0ABT2LK17_9HYPH|nr:TonB family protein [Chelativorans sp. EGI FJ00035]MCT7374936.1 TonB family protein [Chelativorans sp. EGI FJ00035]
MIAWPDTARTREIADAEPVEAPPPSAPRTDAAPSPPLEPHGSPPQEAAPALPAAAPPLYLSAKRARALSLGLIVALSLSAAVHAAVLAYLGEGMAREGLEAADDAISVEIILEAPPAPPARPVEGEAVETPEPEAAQKPAANPTSQPVEAVEADIAHSPLPAEETAPTTAETASTGEGEPADTIEPQQATEDIRPTEAQENQAPEVALPEPAETPSQLVAEPAPETATALALSRENIPVPTPRPEPQVKAEAPTKPARKAPGKPPRSQAAAPAKPTAKKAPVQASTQAPAANAGRKGGATAGEKAAYARRLLSHVERHKRYPSGAARQGAAGAAALSITIDRRGRFSGAQLARSSGHAILDQEALAVARRAAPYPRPPEGVGDRTITFSVTLRFKQ